MTSVLLSLLCQQADIGYVAGGGVVKLTLLLAALDIGVVDTSVGPVRDDALELLELVVLVPHLTTVMNDVGHGGVNDDIAGDMEIGDSGVGVHHGDLHSSVIASEGDLDAVGSGHDVTLL